MKLAIYILGGVFVLAFIALMVIGASRDHDVNDDDTP